MTNVILQNIHKAFGHHKVLDGVDINFKAGQCSLLTGPNGAGKSTLLRICAGIEKPDTCQVHDERACYTWKQYRSNLHSRSVYLHQQAYMFDGTVIDNLAYALHHHSDKSLRNMRIQSALEWAKLEPIANHWAKTLSGGERQRVAIARAWLCSPEIMLLDEPSNNLDDKAKLRTISLLTSLKQQGISLLIASHDPEHFITLADETLELDQGSLSKKTSLHDFDDNIIHLTMLQQA